MVYTPAGGEPEQYDARTLLTSEASIVARTIDMKWPQIKEGLSVEDLDAMRAVTWVLKKRHNPSLRFGEFDPGVDEMVTRCDKQEIENWVDGGFQLNAADPDLSPADIAHALREVPAAAMDPDHARAYIEQCQAAAEAGGKDLAPTAEGAPVPTSSAPSTSATPELSTSAFSPTS
ncbi:hypothetical protein [Streptomyces sp. 840.1]|uniref:hypothetical protein n=1 Tax=Streptomyces sp. 840.1 TaxID=2485152 RepID=UPI0011CE958E|nr:hypothetical protein [Streptomyces sp. 840.1]